MNQQNSFMADPLKHFDLIHDDLCQMAALDAPATLVDLLARHERLDGLCEEFAMFFDEVGTYDPALAHAHERAVAAIMEFDFALRAVEDRSTIRNELLVELRRLRDQHAAFVLPPCDESDCLAALSYPNFDGTTRFDRLLAMAARLLAHVGDLDRVAVLKGPRWLVEFLAGYAEVTMCDPGTLTHDRDTLTAALALWEPLHPSSVLHTFDAALACACRL